MAGLIKREDIEELRSRIDIREVVEGYVTLKSAGIGSWKGLCPFHDERSPSFNVRPQVGQFHCFGCGEGGDVISFLQKIDHLSFTEAVENLAARIGFELHYEEADGRSASGPRREDIGRRQRLLDAHKIAGEFFREQLLSPAAGEGRRFLAERGFDRAAAEHFHVGFAPQGWDGLLSHLRGRGFTEEELRLTGMFSTGSSGNRMYDRFRGRLIWPIRGIGGETIGFGARRLFEEDQGPKYLNTPETQLYKKSQVLYGIELAKKAISRQKQLVVVEGYTDVMACHLAGVETAVATCGTAFGEEHVKVVRRLLSDDGSSSVIFTFDGDEAGQKAALKAFDLNQSFLSQTYVAIEPSGMDPCDLRISGGDQAVQNLIGARRPLVEFAIRTEVNKYASRLDTVDGRIAALRATAPIVAEIRDASIRREYARQLSGWLGVDPDDALRLVDYQVRHPQQRRQSYATHTAAPQQQSEAAGLREASQQVYQRPDPRDPQGRLEAAVLSVILQLPGTLSSSEWERLAAVELQVPAYRDALATILQVGAPQGDQRSWAQRVVETASELLRPVISELTFTQLPAQTEETLLAYARSLVQELFGKQIQLQIQNRTSELLRLDPQSQPEQYRALQQELLNLETQRRALRTE
ncbi:DNA primase [Acaricomes phytoseiuli]|uniref:DNA primase n=1 Tax=Acaricomes phytoseiuli TaxID=291968 RepID=UPI002221C989|nr:DNA primase [Acaricomes phytoseiuli]MCW1250282.1 DNA primase [Acaricomes phytoseiuli]